MTVPSVTVRACPDRLSLAGYTPAEPASVSPAKVGCPITHFRVNKKSRVPPLTRISPLSISKRSMTIVCLTINQDCKAAAWLPHSRIYASKTPDPAKRKAVALDCGSMAAALARQCSTHLTQPVALTNAGCSIKIHAFSKMLKLKNLRFERPNQAARGVQGFFYFHGTAA